LPGWNGIFFDWIFLKRFAEKSSSFFSVVAFLALHFLALASLWESLEHQR